MKITAAAIGSFGDVKPFVELGKEMQRRGHSFKVAAFPRFQRYVEENGLEFAPINGDGDLMMRVLLSECKDGLAYLNGMKLLYRKNPEMISAFAKGHTPYPKWCWIFSMPVGMAATMLLKFTGNHAISNGLTAAWISIGNIWMFGGLLLTMRLAKGRSDTQ